MVEVTPDEWERLWWEEYARLRHAFPTAQLQVIQKATSKLMVGKYGHKPSKSKPIGVPGPPLRLKILALFFRGEKMAAFLKIISRFGPLIAAFLVGLSTVVPGAEGLFKGIVEILALVGITPDAQTAEQLGSLIAGALLLYGSVLKFYKLIRDKFFPKV